jgi:DNA-binding CsgD family transcriptional regulator/energy-coupling factor transporter ATP-binding protein EcfA2
VPLPGPLLSARERPWPIVGREAELAELAAAWRRVADGSGETVLVTGEPGAGKSRLVAEAAGAAHAEGALILYGSGEGAAETPYGPLVTALGDLDRHGTEPLREELLGSSLDALAAQSAGEALWSLGDDRAKLFAAALELLERFARHGPLLLAIDDLHACGPSTLALLRHLARAGRGMPFLLLATYRPTDVDPGGDVAEAIAELGSEAGSRQLQLGALGSPALREIASSLNPGADDAALDRAAATVARESGGNALFACELLRAIDDIARPSPPGPPTPRSLRMLIVTRAHALGEPALACLSAAAAFGRAFAPAEVAAATGVAAAAVEGALATAERAGLVTAAGDGRYAFSHAIVAHCLYEEIEPAARGRLHRRIAELLEAEAAPPTDDGRSAQLAHHWWRAEPGDRERAGRYCAEAGEAALRSHDHELAASWFERALERRDEEREDAELCDLLTGLGVALRYTNQERSRECLLRAARLADRLDEVERLVAAALANHRGFVSQVGGLDRERGAMLRRAGERLGGRGPESALVLAQLALELTFSDQVERRRWLAESALHAAREAGDRRVLAQVLVRCLIARWDPDNAGERIAMAAESIEIGAELDQPLELFHALHWQAVAQLELCEVEAAARSLREQDRIADRIGDATARWLCECSESLHLSLHGRLEEAEAHAQRAVEQAKHSAQPDALPFYISQLCSIRWQEGRMGELAPLLARALHQYPGIPGFRSLVALAHAEAGELDLAREALSRDVATRFADLPRDPIWIATVVDYAYAVARIGDREAATLLHGILDPYRGRLAMTAVAVWGVVDHALGRLELLLGEEEQARRSLHASVDLYAAMQAPLWKARAEADLEPVARAESSLEARIAALGLTARQAEVTRLTARGLSNREIAERLQVSPSTVKRHLENVYRRTGVGSRGALAALLLE